MGLLQENISKLDALDATITEGFLQGEGFEKNMHQSYVKTLSIKNKTGHVFYRLFFCRKKLFLSYPGPVEKYENCDYVFFSPEIYNHGLMKYIGLGGTEVFEDYNWAENPITTIREYFDFLKYLEEKAQLF